ncbi:hypothetical protein HPP92_028485, partial [Vanilla planifolia]
VDATVALVVLGNANKALLDNVLNHCATYIEKGYSKRKPWMKLSKEDHLQ